MLQEPSQLKMHFDRGFWNLKNQKIQFLEKK